MTDGDGDGDDLQLETGIATALPESEPIVASALKLVRTRTSGWETFACQRIIELTWNNGPTLVELKTRRGAFNGIN